MSGTDYLVDTNCFIYLLEEHPLLQSFIADSWGYSFITEMELLSKKNLTASEDKTIRLLLERCQRFNHSQSLTEATIIIKRKYGIKLPDAIIAATAQYAGIPLLTADKQFNKIKEIDCILLEI